MKIAQERIPLFTLKKKNKNRQMFYNSTKLIRTNNNVNTKIKFKRHKYLAFVEQR